MDYPTSKKKVEQPLPKRYIAWTVYNWGIPWSTERTRREAIKYAEHITGKPWRECRKFCRVHKVEVLPL